MLATTQEVPPHFQRLLTLAERDPRRIVPFARCALEQTSPTDVLSFAWAHFTLGWALLQWERFDEARTFLQQAADIFSDQQASIPVLDCQRAIYMANLFSGEWYNVTDRLNDIATCYENNNLLLDTARTRLLLLMYHTLQANTNDAQHQAYLASPIIHTQGNAIDKTILLCLQASIASDEGDITQALHYVNEALTYAQGIHSRRYTAVCLLRRSWFFYRRHQFEEALKNLERAYTLLCWLDLPLYRATCERNMGMVMYRLARYDQAIALLYRAQSHFSAIGRNDMVADCNLSLGNIGLFTGLYDMARAFYHLAETTYREFGWNYQTNLCQRNHAMILIEQHKPAEALALLLPLEESVREIGDRIELAHVLTVQAKAYQELGEYDSAKALYVALYEHHHTDNNSIPIAESLLELGWLALWHHDIATAIEYFTQAQESLSQSPQLFWRVHYGLGRCYELQGNSSKALTAYQTASTLISQQRRTIDMQYASSGIFRKAQQLYTDALRFAYRIGDATALYTLTEQHKALTLQRQLAAPRLHIPSAIQERYQQQRERLQQLVSNSTASYDLNTYIADYMATLLHLRHSTAMPNTLSHDIPTIETLRAQFDTAYPNGWQVVSYAHSDEALIILTLDSQHVELTSTPMDAKLQYLLMQASQHDYRYYTYCDLPHLLSPSRPGWDMLRELGERLIPSPMRERLSPEKRLLIVPCSNLYTIPWAALRIEEDWLCQQAIIQLLPAISLWHPLALRTPSGNHALLIGCSSFFESRAPELPYEKDELDMVAAHWQGSVTRLEAPNATCSALHHMVSPGQDGSGSYRLVHIATHAQMNASQGMLAHIKLWDDDLLVDEVAMLHPGDGALVVLATCEGATGEILAGNEVLSLSQAFLTAGASDVVASLWAFYSDMTQELLATFYHTLLQENHDAATALAYAQRALLRSCEEGATMSNTLDSSPLIWAGLVAMGASVHTMPHHSSNS